MLAVCIDRSEVNACLELLKAVIESSGIAQAELAKVLDIEQGTARSITVDHAKRCAVENAQNQPWQRLKLLTYCGSSDHAELDPYCG